jgi:hypothetical protein
MTPPTESAMFMGNLDPIEFVMVVLTAMGMYTGGLVWLMRNNSGQARDIASIREKEALDIGALRLEVNTAIEASKAVFSERLESLDQRAARSRAELRVELTAQISDVKGEVATIRKEGATKPELQAVEARLTITMTDLKDQIGKVGEKLAVIPDMKASLDLLVRHFNRAMGEKV